VSELGYLFLTVQFAIKIASDLDVRDHNVSWVDDYPRMMLNPITKTRIHNYTMIH
jgi:hypothetical protein